MKTVIGLISKIVVVSVAEAISNKFRGLRGKYPIQMYQEELASYEEHSRRKEPSNIIYHNFRRARLFRH